ncbi:ammonium transporter [Ureaplasma diversum]|uniref:ammonium transporter n=1 Tax=Ureaplasma diversum TaxID=42094 RepID=UPI0009DD723E|nr:ammonium transporter [Ureaplasma diversum]
MSTWGVNQDIYFSTHELSFVDLKATGTTLEAVGFNPTNTLLAALAIAFVLLMTPGLALFYGGLVRRKSTLTIINQCVISLGVTTLIWIFGGFSLAFGPSVGKGIIGDISTYFAFRNLLFDGSVADANGVHGWAGNVGLVFSNFSGGVPLILFFAYQLAFAIITPPLMVGAFADRMKFRNYIVYLVLWQYFIYIPFAHWIWGQGFLAAAGVLDFAGGIVIHTTAGFGALATSFVLGKRVILKSDKNRSNNIPMVVVGATLLFFGWFGFNVGGSAFTSNEIETLPGVKEKVSYFLSVAPTSWINTIIALAIGMVGWAICETIFNKNHKPTSVGLVTGAIAGLATITPAAGYIPIWASVPVGVAAVLVCFSCAKLMHHFHFDDSLEVWAVHGMGGVTGSILIGAFASVNVLPSITYAASGYLFGIQVGATALAAAYAFVLTIIIVFITRPRLSATEQLSHIDIINHNEDAYGLANVYPCECEAIAAEAKDYKSWHRHAGTTKVKLDKNACTLSSNQVVSEDSNKA